jgi:para-aminobenzoate synthetase component 1
MLNWANQFSILAFLDSNNYVDQYSRYECLLAVGTAAEVRVAKLDAVKTLHETNNDWLFGHIGYDHKNTLEPKLFSRHSGAIGFPELYFFVPEVVCHVNTGKTLLTIESLHAPPGELFQQIQHTAAGPGTLLPKLSFKQRIGKEQYLQTIDKLRRHIIDGDCYEINFCNEGYCEKVSFEPLDVFNKLSELSPAPFAAYYRYHGAYMMCASPERYLRKDGDRVLSQPIKGTAPRNSDPVKDEELSANLRSSIKDRAENVMIVDLVRNDLARCCELGSVTVDELFGIYSFPQVHQMISTVSGRLRDDMSFADALKYSFPMGSMTGAPKVKVMELIETYEAARRELFSGTLGYITPGGDFDFNVVIRSLFYNENSKRLSYQTGGAITYDSTAEQEWEEMRLKAWALERIFA